MDNLKLALKNKEVDPKSWQTFREKQIEPKIRNEAGEQNIGYSQNQEFALLRKSIKSLYDLMSFLHSGVIYTDEYRSFMKYCEEVEKVTKSFDLICEIGGIENG